MLFRKRLQNYFIFFINFKNLLQTVSIYILTFHILKIFLLLKSFQKKNLKNY